MGLTLPVAVCKWRNENTVNLYENHERVAVSLERSFSVSIVWIIFRVDGSGGDIQWRNWLNVNWHGNRMLFIFTDSRPFERNPEKHLDPIASIFVSPCIVNVNDERPVLQQKYRFTYLLLFSPFFLVFSSTRQPKSRATLEKTSKSIYFENAFRRQNAFELWLLYHWKFVGYRCTWRT